jgi:hypothetical protein
VCVEKNIQDDCKSIKTFSAKKNVTEKVFGGKNVTVFFKFYNKKKFKILENIFLDFSFSKKQ